MCTGKFVRSFCPQAIAANPLCPHFNVFQEMTPYAQVWVQTKFVCCGGHFGDCVQCPMLYIPGNIEYQDGIGVECPACSARLREMKAGEVAGEVAREMTGTAARPILVDDEVTGTPERPILVDGEDTYVMVPAEREDAYMADSEGDSEEDSDGGASCVSSGTSHVSDSENVEMTDADVEGVVDQDNTAAKSRIVCGCRDCAEFDIVCGCKDCMKE
jgi:hypothetical protein